MTPGKCRAGKHTNPVRLDTYACAECRVEWRHAYRRRPEVLAARAKWRRERRAAGTSS